MNKQSNLFSRFQIPPASNAATITINNLKELEQWTATLSQQLKPGQVLCLNGQMGAGKTTFVQHLGKQLGITERINSPTFTLLHDYNSGRFPVYHVDFYRLGPGGAETLEEELLDIADSQHGLIIAEWAEYAEFITPLTTYTLTITKPTIATELPKNNEEKREILWVTH